MLKPQAITVWTDESEFDISGESYTLIGQLITNSDTAEFDFLNKLKQARKKVPCWNTLHGSKIKPSDQNKIALINEWINIFKKDSTVYFHVFLYRKDGPWARRYNNPEEYFANQCYFGLGNKMKKNGYYIKTMFSDVGTITALFDRRREHIAHILPRTGTTRVIKRLNELENIYEQRIHKQLCVLSGKSKQDLTLRFSFLASKCFDALQLCDVLLYLTRARILKERTGEQNVFSNIWDSEFIDRLHLSIADYRDEPYYNFFESSN